jgi:hypothetical protein
VTSAAVVTSVVVTSVVAVTSAVSDGVTQSELLDSDLRVSGCGPIGLRPFARRSVVVLAIPAHAPACCRAHMPGRGGPAGDSEPDRSGPNQRRDRHRKKSIDHPIQWKIEFI